MTKFTNKKGGFTLIELLVVIGIIAILAAIVIVSINPAKRFQDAQDAQRRANVESILNALQQRMVDEEGELCAGIPTGDEDDADEIADDGVDLAPCLADYLAIMPVDPDTGSWVDADNYSTGYMIVKNADNQVTIFAPDAEGDEEIKVVR